MSKQLGRLEVCCDCPPYAIVKACNLVGLVDAEDVRWCRLSSFLVEHAGWSEFTKMFSWHQMPVNRYLQGSTCTCGTQLPTMQRCLFTTSSGVTFSYMLGQCSRCRSIFWEEAEESED